MRSQLSMESAADIVFVMQRKGVRIWIENGQLRYQAPAGVLTPEDKSKLRAVRGEIFTIIEQSSAHTATERPLTPRSPSNQAPLTFSQQWFWNCFQLQTRSSMRAIAASVRLSGRLDVECLRHSVAEVVRRHESLRTRIIVLDGVPMQCIDAASEYDLQLVDLTTLPKSARDVEAKRLTEELSCEPFFVCMGPVFAAKLMKFGDYDHELAVAIDHIVSDGASLGVLWREIFTMYTQSVRGLPRALPRIPVQFADYAVWQWKTHRSWMDEHGAYWSKRLAGARRVRLLSDEQMQATENARWATLPIRFGEALSSELRELSRRERTTLVMSVLASYVALVCCWSNKSDLVVPFTTLGRMFPELSNTVGFFGTPLFLRLELPKTDSFLDLLHRVTNEYGAAYEHDDSCRIAAQMPSPEFVWNPIFNWIPQEFNMSPTGYVHSSNPDDLLRMEPHVINMGLRAGTEWEGEFRVDLSDKEEGVTGTIGYRADRLPLCTVERIERNFRFFAGKLIEDPEARVAGTPCVP